MITNRLLINRFLYSTLLLLWGILSLPAYGQPYPPLGDKETKPVKDSPLLKGSLSTRLMLYHTNGLQNRFENPTWSISGMPVLEWGEFRMPIRINAGNRENPLAQYFNKIGISPTYKWAALHLGYNNVYYSPFTLSGRTFVGAGIELNPSVLRFGALYGKFQKPEEEKFDADRQLIIPARFERRGYAFKLGVGRAENYVDLLYFHAEDDSTSISFADRASAFPARNTVFGITSRQRLWRVFHFGLDAAMSAYTRNQYSDSTSLNKGGWEGAFGRLISPRLSTHYHYALQGVGRLQLKNFGLETRYRRVDSDYRSMGNWFLLADVEDITISPRFNLLDRKIRVRARYGWQRNNLSQLGATNSFRQVGSARLDIVPNRKLSVQFSYSNFHFDQTKQREWLPDTVLFSRINTRFRASIRYLLPSQHLQHRFSASSYRRQSERDTEAGGEVARTVGYTLRYQLRWRGPGLMISPELSYYEYRFADTASEQFSTNLGIGQAFFRQKLSASYYLSYNLQPDNGSRNRIIWRHRLNVQYRLTDQLHIRLFGNLIRSKRATSSIGFFTESIASLELAFQF